MFNELTNEEVLGIDGGGLARDAAEVIGLLVEWGAEGAEKLSQFDPTGIALFIMSDPRLWLMFGWLL